MILSGAHAHDYVFMGAEGNQVIVQVVSDKVEANSICD